METFAISSHIAFIGRPICTWVFQRDLLEMCEHSWQHVTAMDLVRDALPIQSNFWIERCGASTCVNSTACQLREVSSFDVFTQK